MTERVLPSPIECASTQPCSMPRQKYDQSSTPSEERGVAEAAATTIVMVAAIYVLSKKEAFAPKRASHQLRIRVNNDIQYDEAFYPIFEEFADATELISVESIQAGMMTELRWGILLKTGVEISDFMEKLQVASGNNRVILTSTQRSFDR